MKQQPANKIEEHTETTKQLLEEIDKGNIPLFEAPDRKILATADLFRGPYTGFTSDFDLNNPGRNLPPEDIMDDEDI